MRLAEVLREVTKAVECREVSGFAMVMSKELPSFVCRHFSI